MIPPPLKFEDSLKIDVSLDILRIIYIEEIEKYVKATYIFKKSWFNSYLTFQNLKKDARNFMFPEDRENIWIPWIPTQNIENKIKCIPTEDEDFISVLQNEKFEYTHNSKEFYQNAFLFKVSLKSWI